VRAGVVGDKIVIPILSDGDITALAAAALMAMRSTKLLV
jgi:hypothetical protein